MNGQYSIFNEKGKPYSYSFERYIGQKVEFWRDNPPTIGTIKRIEPYYTIVEVNGREWAGINVTIRPVDEKERSKA